MILEARTGKRDKTLRLLRDARDHGLPAREGLGMINDTDLTFLHADPRFGALLAHAKELAAAKKAQ